MARPKRFRQLSWIPPATLFLPQGVGEGSPRVLTLRLEEVEVLRQIDLEGLEQEDVADRMSRKPQQERSLLRCRSNTAFYRSHFSTGRHPRQ